MRIFIKWLVKKGWLKLKILKIENKEYCPICLGDIVDHKCKFCEINLND